MDPFTLIRDIGSTPDPASRARIARSRARVVAQLSAAAPHRSRPRRVWPRVAALGGLSTATVAVVAVVIGLAAPAVVSPASAAAAEVLNDAAAVVITGADPVVGPGQYVRIRETSETVSLWAADAGSNPAAGFNTATLATAEGAVRVRGIRDLYVPGDRNQDWILDDRATNELLEVWGDPRTADAYAREAALAAAPPGTDADPTGIRALPGGADEDQPFGSEPQVTASPDVAGSGVPTPSDDRLGYYDRYRPFYDEMPRDPQQLLAWYRQHLTASSEDWYIFESIGRGLQTNLMPKDLRAASLRVLGLLGDVRVAAVHGSVTTLALATRIDSSGGSGNMGDLLVSELDIDTTTGRIVGVRETYPGRATSLIPADIPWVSWQVEVSVVDVAPTP